MKRFSITRLFAAMLFITFSILTSCQRDVDSITADSYAARNQSDVFVLKGILVFRDPQMFQSYLIGGQSPLRATIKNFEKNNDFMSLASYQDFLNKNNGTKESESPFIKVVNGQAQLEFIHSHLLNTVNKDGYVIVGGLLYKYSNEEVKAIALSSAHEFNYYISALENATKSDKSKLIAVSPVKAISVKMLDDNKGDKNARQGVWGTYDLYITTYDSNNLGQTHQVTDRFYTTDVIVPIYDHEGDYGCEYPGRVYDSSMGLCWPIIIGYQTPTQKAVTVSAGSTFRLGNNYHLTNLETIIHSSFNIYVDNNLYAYVEHTFNYPSTTSYLENIHYSAFIPINSTVEIDGSIVHSMTNTYITSSVTRSF